MGDFNEVREESERLGSVFCPRSARVFNSFIEQIGLQEVSLGGPRFTWCDKWGSKFSKVDRFFVTDGFCASFPFITALVLEKKIPDHRPILLTSIRWIMGRLHFGSFIRGLVWRVLIRWFGLLGGRKFRGSRVTPQKFCHF